MIRTERASQRDQRLRQAQWAEAAYVVVFGVLFVAALRGPVAAPVFWAGMAVAMVSGQAIWLWQYRLLDERGQAAFLKGWMVFGMVLGNAVTLILVWALFQWRALPDAQRVSGVETVPFWPLYLALVLGATALYVTRAALRGRERA